MGTWRWIWAAGWLWALAGPLWAGASAGFSIDRIDTDQGLPQSVVFAVTQTRDGYLWVGTLAGLARFDGLRFTTFDENNTPGLNSSHITRLFEDSRTNLWLGTDTGDIVMVRGGVVSSPGIPSGGREGELRAICEDPAGAVWLYTANGLLYRYQDGKIIPGQEGPAAPSTVRALILQGTNTLWLGTDHSLSAWSVTAGPSSRLIFGLAREMPVTQLHYLLASPRGGYWRLADGRIQKFQGDQVERDYGAYPWTNTLPVIAACEDQEGNLIVGTYGDGVYWFDPQGRATHLRNEPGKSRGLSNNYILSLTVDREGCLWVGTNGGGLNRVRRNRFEILPGSEGEVVQSVADDPRGGLWIGYNKNRVDRWNGAALRPYRLLDPASLRPLLDVDPDAFLNVKAVFVEAGGQVLAGTRYSGEGPHLYGLQGERFQELRLPLPSNRNISAIFQDRSGRLWLGTQTGLAVVDSHSRQGKFFSRQDGLSADDVRALAEDRAGNLWIGTDGGGLNRLKDGRLAIFRKQPEGLPSDNIASLYVDGEDVLWAGTSGGLARFAGGHWTRYTRDQGLVSDNIGYLLEDPQGYLWLGSYNGLMRVSKAALNQFARDKSTPILCRVYGAADGLPSSNCTFGSQPAACRAGDGSLWFPTSMGLARVDPRLLRPNTNPPPVLIESILVDGHPQGATSLRASAPTAITVPAGKESIEIHFTSLNLAAPEKGLFRYRLEHHESSWTERPGSVRYARYPKLPHGHYTFQVTACNEDGEWNKAGAALQITVLPPFWQTWWFLSLTTLVLLGLIVASVHYVSTQRLQRQLAALRQKEALERERARIARDLHDQLGANLTQVALLGEMAETDKDLPAEVEAHARQIAQTARDTTNALDEIVWTVNPSNDTLDGLINYVCKYAQEYLALANLRYRLEVPPQLPNSPISPELRHNVFLAAKEAVNNVVKHSQASAAWLRLRIEPDRFTLEIEDNGRGLPPNAADKGRNGLRNMRKRLEDIGGSFDLRPGAEGGTLVCLVAPIGKTTGAGRGPKSEAG
jgi:signal transduction histidine kinase/ligand-binding sensor domain-containing protein